jgi:hypothetical protein
MRMYDESRSFRSMQFVRGSDKGSFIIKMVLMLFKLDLRHVVLTVKDMWGNDLPAFYLLNIIIISLKSSSFSP